METTLKYLDVSYTNTNGKSPLELAQEPMQPCVLLGMWKQNHATASSTWEHGCKNQLFSVLQQSTDLRVLLENS